MAKRLTEKHKLRLWETKTETIFFPKLESGVGTSPYYINTKNATMSSTSERKRYLSHKISAEGDESENDRFSEELNNIAYSSACVRAGGFFVNFLSTSTFFQLKGWSKMTHSKLKKTRIQI